MSKALVSRSLWKIYPGGVEALRGVDLSVDKGTITSILGRNGAGKTTFIKIATTQLLPTSGSVEVLGYDVVSEFRRVRELIALMPQGGALPGYVTPFEFIYFYLAMRGFSFSEARRRARDILSVFGLDSVSDRKCADLSLGTQQRVLAAAAIASDADVVFLDEPTSGIDVIARKAFWGYMDYVKRSGRTFIITTHIPEEAELVSDYIVVFDRGRVVAQGPPRELVSGLGFSYAVEVSYGSSFNLGDLDADLVVDVGGSSIMYFRDPDYVEHAVSRVSRVIRDVRVRRVNVMDVLIIKSGGRVGLD